MNKLKQKFIKIVESDHNLYEQVLNRKHIETLGNKFTEATKEWLKQKPSIKLLDHQTRTWNDYFSKEKLLGELEK